jgi:hypothetical protein
MVLARIFLFFATKEVEMKTRSSTVPFLADHRRGVLEQKFFFERNTK